jgi:hypothetical protein
MTTLLLRPLALVVGTGVLFLSFLTRGRSTFLVLRESLLELSSTLKASFYSVIHCPYRQHQRCPVHE